jgi:cold-inducible RNA-binding protein
MEVKLYVGNLSFSTTEDELRTLFAEVGSVVDVALIKDRDTGSSKGFAFVTMSTQAEAIKKYNGFSFGNRELKVNAARPKEETGRGGGFGGPRGGGGGGNSTYGRTPGRNSGSGDRNRRGGSGRY